MPSISGYLTAHPLPLSETSSNLMRGSAEGSPLCRGLRRPARRRRGVSPRILVTFLGWAGGRACPPQAGTTPTPTPPISLNAPDDTRQRNADREARVARGAGILPAAVFP